MRNILTALLCLSLSVLAAQPLSKLTCDTLTANKMLSKAVQPEKSNSEKLQLLTQASLLYEECGLVGRVIRTQGKIALIHALDKDKEIHKIVVAAVKLAEENFSDKFHPSTFDSYLALEDFYKEKPDERTESDPIKLKIARLGLLGMSYVKVNESQVGLALAEEAIELAKQNKLPEYSKLDRSYLIVGLSDEVNNAIPYGQKVLNCTESTEVALRAYDLQIEIMSDFRKFREAETTLDKMKKLLDASPDYGRYQVNYYDLLARLEYYKQNYSKAIIAMDNAIELDSKYHQYTGSERAEFYIYKGNIHTSKSEFDKGIEFCKIAIDTFAFYSSDSCSLGACYSYLASAYSEKRDYENAILTYKKQISLQKKHCGEADLSTDYHMYGYALNGWGKLDEALSALDTAMFYTEKYDNNWIRLENYGLAAQIHSKLKYFDKSLQFSQKSIVGNTAHFDDLNIASNPEYHYTDNYYNVGLQLYYKAGALIKKWEAGENTSLRDLEYGIETNRLAIRFFETAKDNLEGFEASKQRYRMQLANVYNQLLKAVCSLYQTTLDPQHLELVFEEFEERKGAVLVESLPLVSDILPADWSEKERNLYKQKCLLENTLFAQQAMKNQDSILLYQDKLFAAADTYKTFIEETEKDYPKFVNLRFKEKQVSRTELQSNLSANHLFVEYVYINNDLYTLTTASSGSKLQKTKLSDKFFEDISSMQKLLTSSLLLQKKNREKFIDISHRIYGELISPIESELAGKTRLTIIPEEQLFYIPFEVLLPSNEKNSFDKLDYLVKQLDINYHYSATAYEQLQAKTKIEDGSLLAFAPVFEKEIAFSAATRSLNIFQDSTDLYRGFDNDSFSPLPGSKKEVKGIAQILDNKAESTVLLQEKATKIALIEKIEEKPYQFIHLATHGLVNYDNPKLSGLACYRAEDNTTHSDFYFANEIQTQDIRADLVVLSSCESGIGQLVSGEGLIALNRSFIYSGANNVLFSLWKIDDRYSSDLMTKFYKNYTEGKSYTAALRAAKLGLLEDTTTASPRYWAPFILMGE